MQTRAKDGIFKPKYLFVGLLHTESDFLLSQAMEPKSVAAALASPHWSKAMKDEFEALQRNNTWILVPSTGAEKLVDCKWVFKPKFKPDGSILKHKARLVAKGFQQTPDVDFGETFNPVVKPTSIWIVLTLVVSFSWEIRQLDVNNAFLNGVLQETVYLKQPEGCRDQQRPNHICKLVKALYGLKQAPRAWFERLRDTLISWGFYNSKSDHSLFILRTKGFVVFILIYVDDILITGNNSIFFKTFVQRLNQLFSLIDLGPAFYFLGVEICKNSKGLFLSQSKYTLDLLKRFGMMDCAPVSTPMVTGKQYSKQDGIPMTGPYLYRQAIGSLQYLTTTRPDIAYSVNKLSQFLSSPTDVHFQGVKRIFRYLKGTHHLALHIKPCKSLSLTAFTDADWATDVDDRRSTAGICVFLGDTLISWASRKQKVVSRSSTESEYRALADGAAEL